MSHALDGLMNQEGPRSCPGPRNNHIWARDKLSPSCGSWVSVAQAPHCLQIGICSLDCFMALIRDIRNIFLALSKPLIRLYFSLKRVHRMEGTVTFLHKYANPSPVSYRGCCSKMVFFKIWKKKSVMPFFVIACKWDLNKQRKTIINVVSEAVHLETKRFLHIQPHYSD